MLALECALVWLSACVDNGSTFNDAPQYTGGYARALVGCDKSEEEFVDELQRFLGCPEPTASPMPAPAAGSSEPGSVAPEDTGGVPMSGVNPPSAVNAGQGGAPASAPVTGGMGGTPALPSTPTGAVACGTTMCAASAGTQVCCADAATGTCGVLSGATCTGAPVPTGPCPGIDLTRQGFGMLPACCTATKRCGVNTMRLPGGTACSSLEDAKRQAEAMGMGSLVPEPRACPNP